MPISLTRISIFADGLDHPECVTVHPDSSVWAGGEAGQIYRISADGSQVDEIARMKGGFILGLAIHPSGEWLIACDLKNHCLWRIETRTGRSELFAMTAGQHEIVIPNSVCFDMNERIFVSESGLPKKRLGKIMVFNYEGRGEVWHRGPFDFANGIALDPEEQHLYVVESFLPGISRVEIRDDGSAGKRQLVTKLPRTIPDGIAFDHRGVLHATCYTPSRIYRIVNGKASVLVDDWETHLLAFPTNIAFASKDELLVANLGRWHISKIRLGRGAKKRVKRK
jgi:sugar lactone lactonase YvrE